MEILPCRKCGSNDVDEWDGRGTQAEMLCKECGSEEGVQVSDILEQAERFAPENSFDMNSLRYPENIIAKAKAELVREWNRRADESLQAENARLREALERLARLGNGDHYGNSDGNMIARAALAKEGRCAKTG